MNKKLPIREYQIDDEQFGGVYAMSVVDYPAIEVDFVAMNKQKQIKMAEVNEEKRMLYGPALIPNQHIYRIDPETKEEYYAVYSDKVVEQCAHLFLKKNQHHNHTVMHELPVTGLTIVESWIKMGDSDKSNSLGFDLPQGTWFIGCKVENDEVWQLVKEGKVRGFSIEAFFMWVGESMTTHSPTIEDLEKDLERLKKLLHL
jgi:hypothetical protein